MTISALDENGKPVDWWFLYKVPQLTKDASTASATGYEYVYFDPTLKEVVRSPNVLTNEKGALDLTLNSVFKNPADTTGWILYNDEMPASAKRADSGQFGHTKGVIAFDGNQDSILAASFLAEVRGPRRSRNADSHLWTDLSLSIFGYCNR